MTRTMAILGTLVFALAVSDHRVLAGSCCEFPNNGAGALGCSRADSQTEVRQCPKLGGFLVGGADCNAGVTNNCDITQPSSEFCSGTLSPVDPTAFKDFLAVVPHLKESKKLAFDVEMQCQVIPPLQIGRNFFLAVASPTSMKGQATLLF